MHDVKIDDELQPVPPFHKGKLGWSDYLYLGARRAVKTLVYVGGVAASVAGVAVLKGVPLEQAALGAGLIAVGSAATMGGEKVRKEYLKSKGKNGNEWIDRVIKLVEMVIKLIVEFKKKRREK